jgi:hypothetical protein
MMTKLGRFDEIDSEISKMVEDMSPEEFSDQFGYTNLTEQELLERKTATLKTFKPLMNFSNPTFQKIWNAGQKTFKTSGVITKGALPEGFEEISQSFLSKYNKAYYSPTF